MLDKLNLLIYRAKKIDSDEYVEGYYQQFWDDEINKRIHQIFWETRRDEDKPYAYDHHFKLIDPSTLEISFDGGETFNNFVFVNACIEQTAIRDSRSCGNCLYYNDNNECEVIDKDMGEEHYCSLWKEMK